MGNAAVETIPHSVDSIRSDWQREEVADIYNLPLLELAFRAAQVTRQFHKPSEVQLCTLLSIKTGGCTEDCKYCSQSIHNKTDLENHGLLNLDKVLKEARAAKDQGSSRFCMGAAWREVKDNRSFEKVLEMVRGVSSMGLEVCCTLGMLTEEQAHKLKEAGVHAYNHNLDTSERFYSEIISTRTYKDRLDTLKNVRKAGMTICCGGILGLGESEEDRIDLLHTLATLSPHPESVPVNCLVPVAGTPLGDKTPVSPLELVRMIASARILMPKAMVRLSAGRRELSAEAQALCFLAGANSIFSGEKLLTTPNPEQDLDIKLFSDLGLTPMESVATQEVYVEKSTECVHV